MQVFYWLTNMAFGHGAGSKMNHATVELSSVPAELVIVKLVFAVRAEI